ncbi:hypothetical protein MKX70_20150 [Paenibacillus sp. FSL R7-0312]|uniref:hypothetical protein n=1 Tax=Paenibacillus sp. FSL R7-0312 TaxID=2921682 RepID=UPI0030FA395D
MFELQFMNNKEEVLTNEVIEYINQNGKDIKAIGINTSFFSDKAAANESVEKIQKESELYDIIILASDRENTSRQDTYGKPVIIHLEVGKRLVEKQFNFIIEPL